MSEPEGQSQDDLLNRARKAQSNAERASQTDLNLSRSRFGRFIAENETLSRIRSVLQTIEKWTGPVGRFIGWTFRTLASAFKFAAFRRQDGQYILDSDGDLVFSGRRFLYTLFLYLAAAVMIHMALSAAYFYGTYFQEMVYVTGKQEIETGEKYQFGGCTSLPCSTLFDNGKFYLIETSLYFPKLFYPEEEVFANIPQQNGACSIEGYGIYFRSLRWLYKHAQLYQHVVQVSCRPYTEDEIRKAVDSGEILTNPSSE